MEEGTNVEVTYKIQKDGSGVGVFLNDYPILMLPPEEFYEYAKLTVQAAREMKRYEQEKLAPMSALALGISMN